MRSFSTTHLIGSRGPERISLTIDVTTLQTRLMTPSASKSPMIANAVCTGAA